MINSKKQHFDISIYLIIIIFMGLSCAFIYSAQQSLPYDDNFAFKQAVWFIVGIISTSIVYLFDFEQIKKLSIYLYIFGVLVLVMLMFSPESIAPEIKGIKAWFSFPGIGSIQPSEFMKIFLILFLASIITDHNSKNLVRSLKLDFWLLAKILFTTSIPLFLILKQPDTGTGLVIISISIGMIFISKINWKIILSLILLGGVLVSVLSIIYVYYQHLLLLLIDQFQLDRIHSWLDPFSDPQGVSYQLSQSIISIASGMINGNGYNQGNVYVPESHSDFIFTVISSEFGFIGATGVLILYFFLFYKVFTIALINQGEYECLIAAGVSSMLTFHIFENVGMVIGLVPITGIPLPLFSYGGSSILSTIFALSIVMNISLHTKKYMFGGEDSQ